MEQFDEKKSNVGGVDIQKFDPNKVIVNYLPDALTDEELSSLFGTIGSLKSTKIVRDKVTGISLGYGFVEFESADDAARAIEKFHGLNLQQKRLRVAYARWPGTPETAGANVHVRNLEASVSADEVEQQFGQFGEIVRARVLTDPQSGQSRGIAFVLFGSRDDAERAVSTLNGAHIQGFARGPLCVRFAIDNKTKAHALYAAATGVLPGGVAGFPVPFPSVPALTNAVTAQQYLIGTGYGASFGGGPVRPSHVKQRFNPLMTRLNRAASIAPAPAMANLVNANSNLRMPNPIDVNSLKPHLRSLWTSGLGSTTPRLPVSTVEHPAVGVTTPGHILFIYNLSRDSDDRDLWQLFSPFGAVQKVNIIMDHEKNQCKGYGFVTMTNIDEVMTAINQLNGFTYKGRQLQVSLKTQKQRGLPTVF